MTIASGFIDDFTLRNPYPDRKAAAPKAINDSAPPILETNAPTPSIPAAIRLTSAKEQIRHVAKTWDLFRPCLITNAF
jgi:hypothetical protein